MRIFASSFWPCIRKSSKRSKTFWRKSDEVVCVECESKAFARRGSDRRDRRYALTRASRASSADTWPQDEVTRNFDKTLTLGAGQSVRVEHKFGEVKVHGESGSEVKISAVIRAQASSHEEAESFAQKIQIEVQQTASGVSIRTIYPPEENRWFHISRHSSWSV